MPIFPTYRGELPPCLNPLSLRHYFLLAYWIYFRPMALKRYLYTADPDFYSSGPTWALQHALSVPAYRHLYLMLPGATALLSLLIGIPITLLFSWSQAMPIDWLRLGLGLAAGILFGLALGIAFSTAYGMASGIAGGLAFGAASAIGATLTFGMAYGIAASTENRPWPITLFSLALFCVGWGLAISVTFGAGRYIAGGVALGIGIGAIGSMIGLGLAAVLYNHPYSPMLVLAGLASTLIFGIGATRLVFYPFQVGLAWYSASRGKRHPLEWDDLLVFPLPGTLQVLARRLDQNESDGLSLIAQITHNPFQRWGGQASLQSYLHTRPLPLHLIYTVLTHPELDALVPSPTSPNDWLELPTARRLLLGELDRQQVRYGQNWAVWLADRFVWWVTWQVGDRRKTPLTRFAGMLYELLDESAAETNEFDLAPYEKIYTGLRDYVGGAEIARSYGMMATCLRCRDLDAVTAIGLSKAEPFDNSAIRPTVLTALAQLGQVGAEAAAYQSATSRVNKLAALARATDTLDDLDEYITAQVVAPEQTILRRIIRQWRRLVSEAGGAAGRAVQIGPVANPYVLNNPVQGELFIGREDVLRRLEELWTGEGQKPSVVIYGHRRMGKSSILKNLGARFGAQTTIIDFNMQRVGLVSNTGELLYNLALALSDAQTFKVSETLKVLEDAFTAHNPYTAFDRFLRQLDPARNGRRFIIAVDEFELVEKAIVEGQLEARLLDFWRGLIQTYPWFVMAFAGLHTLQEMTRDYWHPLFGSVIAIPVSFLNPEAARRLITEPAPDFSLDYDADAIERIIALTHGQPYLTQLVCHGLVTRFNRQAFEEGVERERRFSLADVQATIGAPEFFRDGDAYFSGVWIQADKSEPVGQTDVLRAIAPSEAGLPLHEIALGTGLDAADAQRALEALARHDVVVQEGGGWKFTVELMRRWVAQKEASDGLRPSK